jgi:serine/threonine protein kinase
VSKRGLSGQWFGPWRLLNKLGGGGNGYVYRATGRNNEIAAVKVANVKRMGTAGYKRFQREIEFLLNTEESGVIPTKGGHAPPSFEERGHAWLAMAVATTLEDALGKDATLERTVQAVYSYAHTLANLRDKGISHRDIKPENLFYLSETCEWVIGDFGLVELPQEARVTAIGQKLGPQFYIAPEMLNYARDSSKADVYSLAKVLWKLVTGERYPSPHQLRRDVAALRLSEWVNHPRAVLLEAVLDAATRHDTEERLSMRDFERELAQWLQTDMDNTDEPNINDVITELQGYLGPYVDAREQRGESMRSANNALYAIEPLLNELNTTIGRAIPTGGSWEHGTSIFTRWNLGRNL